jgi:hypothetical protein
MSMKLDVVPTGAWDGWAMLLPPRPKDGQQAPQRKPVASRVPGSDDDLDDPPF